MSEFNPRSHWEDFYRTRNMDQVSWYQRVPEVSLGLIRDAGIEHGDAIIDIGSGTSTLVDALLDSGYADVSVLDISSLALNHAKSRLGEKADHVYWYEADVTGFQSDRRYKLWHDRAVFHFLTDADHRRCYIETLDAHLEQDGRVIVATFSLNGPEKCSGLDIVQYDEEKISKEFGEGFELYHSVRELHITPDSGEQAFTYFCFRRRGAG